MNNIAQTKHREDLANSPCKAGDIMISEMLDDDDSYAQSGSTGSCYGEGLSIDVHVQDGPKVAVGWHEGMEISSNEASINSYASTRNVSKGTGSDVVDCEIGRLQVLLSELMHGAE